MVTNRDRKTFWSRRKDSKSCSDDWHSWRLLSAFRHFGTHFAESFRMSKSLWMMDQPAHVRFPFAQLTEIRRSSKISSWIWSIISRVVTILGRLGWGAPQVEKSLHLKWATQFLMVAYDGACSRNVPVSQNVVNFLRRLALQGGKKTRWQLASRCFWNHARPLTCFLSASITRKDLQFGTWTDPSFQRHYRFRPTTSKSR